MPTLEHLPADAPGEAVLAAVERGGAVIIDGLVSAGEADAVLAELTPYLEAALPGGDAFVGLATRRIGALVARSPRCRDLVMNPSILDACDRFLLPSCVRYILHVTQAIAIGPGQPKQPLHRDRGAWGPWLKGIEPQLNTIWAITDFTYENGATQVVPGSQAWEAEREAADGEIAYAEMKRGSVLIYTGSVVHGGGANTSNTHRVGLNLTYALGWLRQEENQYLSCPPEVASNLDPALRDLLGYAMHGYALGYYSPPLPPGEGLEVVPPSHAVRRPDEPALKSAFHAQQPGAAE